VVGGLSNERRGCSMSAYDIIYGVYAIEQFMFDMWYIVSIYKIMHNIEKDRSKRK
jgi:hypothetical protein